MKQFNPKIAWASGTVGQKHFNLSGHDFHVFLFCPLLTTLQSYLAEGIPDPLCENKVQLPHDCNPAAKRWIDAPLSL